MNRVPTALQAGLARCPSCALLTRLSRGHEPGICPRCDSVVVARKPQMYARTLALVISAYLLYIPANLLPVTFTTTIKGSDPDTIYSGIVYFWVTGSWPLAIIVFTASIAVPMLKLVTLSYLLWTAHHGSTTSVEMRTRLYRTVALIGRWSMLDIYVVALLVSLVDFQPLASIIAGPGVIAFGGVVVLTLLAAESFDPRALWDPFPCLKHLSSRHD